MLSVGEAQAQVVRAPFDASYSVQDLGAAPGVPGGSYGGLVLKPGTTDRLLLSRGIQLSTGALYEIGLTRDAEGRITGFAGAATRYADAAEISGGLDVGPGDVLFLSRSNSNALGQTKPGSASTDKIIPLAPFGVPFGVEGVRFVPPGLPGAGSLKLSGATNRWYDASVTPDGTGTYDLQAVSEVGGQLLSPREATSFDYVRAGSPQFADPAMLVSQTLSVVTYDLDADGNPVPATLRSVVEGVSGVTGGYTDPVSGDYLFTAGDNVYVLHGFAAPTATLTVVKHVVNDGGGTLEAGSFDVHVRKGQSDVNGSPQPGSETGTVFHVPGTGAYTVTEAPVDGYARSYGGDCDATGSVTLGPGESKTCVLTNDDIEPRLTVVKHVVNDNGGTASAGDWTMHIKAGDPLIDVNFQSPFPGEDVPGTERTLSAGTFVVSESGGPMGYAATIGGACALDGTVTLALAQTASCTITNDDVAVSALTLEEPADGAVTTDATPTFAGTAGTAVGDAPSVTVQVYAGEEATGTPAASLTATVEPGGAWSVEPVADLADGTYTAQAEQVTAGGTGRSAARTFRIDATAPVVTIDSPFDGQTLQDSLPPISGTAGGGDGDDATVAVELWHGTDTSGAPLLTLSATRDFEFWQVRPAIPLPNGLYSARATQGGSNGTGISDVVSFTIAAPAEMASAGPLTRIRTTPDLGCAVDHIADQSGEFFGEFACGTLLVIGGTLFGPVEIPAGGAASPRTPFTPVSQTVGGTGTAADPLSIVTVVDAGGTGVRITQRDTYVIGEESYRTVVEIDNTGAGSRAITLYRAGDCYLQDSDTGLGEIDTATGAVACKSGDSARIQQWFPLSSGSHFFEAGYSELWARIGAQQEFPDTCRCAENIDNGAGLSWSATLAAGATTTRAHLTTFSPTGRQPLTMAKTADAASTGAGGENGYTITIRNPGDVAVSLDSVTDTLPAGFAYRPGTTTGAATTDPSIAGRDLAWSGPIEVPANGEVTLRFGVTVSETPGDYLNEATAAATGPAVVVGTGPTAPVTVTPVDEDTTPPAISLTEPADGTVTSDSTPTFAGAAGAATGDSATVTVKVFAGADTTGSLVATLSATRGAGGAFSVAASPALPDGTYTARAQQSDDAGNTGTSATRTFRVDTTAPAVTVVQPADGSRTNDATPEFSGAAGDVPGDGATVTLTIHRNGVPQPLVAVTRTGALWSFTLAALSDGDYTVRATQSDAAGNTGASVRHDFTIDTAAPTVALTAPADGSSTEDTTPTFSGTAGNATGDSPTVTVKIFDGPTLVTTVDTTRTGSTWTVDLPTALAVGSYTARAEQFDDLGNGPGVSNTRMFTILRAAPTVTLTSPPARTGDATPMLAGTAGDRTGDSAVVTVKVFTGASATGTPAAAYAPRYRGTWTFDGRRAA